MSAPPLPDVSVVICTFNRCATLPIALGALTSQSEPASYEIIIVDNNSTDGTPPLAAEWRRRFPRLVRCINEPRQGLPHARNAGIRAARAPIVAFTDDDVEVAGDWVSSIKIGFDAHDDVDVIGGKVLPRWRSTPPPWFSQRLLAPLALQDKGEVPMRVHAGNAAPCLIGANFAFRRRVFERVGLFDPAFVRAQDREIQLRLWAAGGQGLYAPHIVTWVDVPADRLTKRYFRMWHARSGVYASRMRLLERIDRDGVLKGEPEAAGGRRLFGAPAYLYREALDHAQRLVAAATSADQSESFYEECKLRFVTAYLAERFRRGVPPSTIPRLLNYPINRLPDSEVSAWARRPL